MLISDYVINYFQYRVQLKANEKNLLIIMTNQCLNCHSK
jgi:hypothetical protein